MKPLPPSPPAWPDDLLPNLVEGLPGGIYVVRDDRVLYANRELAELFGRDPGADWVGTDFFAALYPDPGTADLVRQGHREILHRGCAHNAWTQPCSRSAGSPFWLEIEARQIQVGGAAAILGWVHDATDCKLISEAMHASQGTLRGLLDAMEDQVYLVDEEFRILYANERMTRAGHGNPDVDPCYTVCRGISRPCDVCTLEEVLEAGKTVHRELRDERAGVWYSVVELPVRVPGSTRLAKLGVRRDITLRKEAEHRIRALSHRLMESQEVERSRLSRELHDDLGQQLNAIKIGIETLQHDCSTIAPELARQAAHLSRLLQNSIQSVRRLSAGLRPPSLERLGLVNALREHCSQVAAVHPFEVDFRAVGMDSLELGDTVAINLYRVAQEALHNVAKHAQAGRASVRVTASYPNVLLRIEDNGVGFDSDRHGGPARRGEHLGLLNMAERIDLLDGTFQLASQPGGGTVIRVEVPLRPSGA